MRLVRSQHLPATEYYWYVSPNLTVQTDPVFTVLRMMRNEMPCFDEFVLGCSSHCGFLISLILDPCLQYSWAGNSWSVCKTPGEFSARSAKASADSPSAGPLQAGSCSALAGGWLLL